MRDFLSRQIVWGKEKEKKLLIIVSCPDLHWCPYSHRQTDPDLLQTKQSFRIWLIYKLSVKRKSGVGIVGVNGVFRNKTYAHPLNDYVICPGGGKF